MDEGLPGTAPAHLGNFAQEMAWGGGCGSPPTGKWRWVEHGWPGGLWQGPNPARSWGSETPEALPGAQRRMGPVVVVVGAPVTTPGPTPAPSGP